MLANCFILTLAWVLGISFVTANLTPIDKYLGARHDLHASPAGTSLALRRAFHSANLKRDTVLKGNASLDKSWNDATLFKIETLASSGNTEITAGIEIVCKSCYIKGVASSQFTISGNLNASEIFHNITSHVKDDVVRLTTTVIDSFETQIEDIADNPLLISSFDLDNLINNFDFDIDIPEIPACLLSFEFEGLELYMQIDTILSGGITYTLPLYVSETLAGIKVGKDIQIGLVFTIDLILSVEAQIEISSGFHILLENLVIDIPMFSKKVGHISYNGGHFEFLPVTIESAGVILKAILRIGASVGLEVSTPATPNITVLDHSFGTVSSGVIAGVWANIAEFVTNVTVAPAGDENGCKLRVVEEYSMAVGAEAGATVAADEHTWGPAPATSVVVWFTTMADVCAITASTTASTRAIKERVDLTPTTTTTKISYKATGCQTTGLAICPPASQTIIKHSTVLTLTTSLPSGIEATWPAITQNAVSKTVAFGTNVKALAATSGSPVSYVPTSSTTIGGGLAQFGNKRTGGATNKVIIGVSVGIGLPALIAILAGCLYLLKRRSRHLVEKPETIDVGQQGLSPPKLHTAGSYTSTKKSPAVAVVENLG